jgi:hypothetical protein
VTSPTNLHPLFEETQPAAFFSPEITGYRRVKWPDEKLVARHVVARYTNGDPAVIEHTLGNGRVVVVTTTPDDRDFRLNGSILPVAFFFNAAHYLVPDDAAQKNVLVGGSARVPLPGDTREVVVEPPEEAGGPRRQPVEDQPEFLLDDTPAPGFYRVVLKGVTTSGTTSRPREELVDVAVNLDPDEGDLRRLTPTELKAWLPEANLHFSRDVDEVLPRGGAGGEDEASRAMLGGVVVLLFLELVLAWRFGRRRRTTA